MKKSYSDLELFATELKRKIELKFKNYQNEKTKELIEMTAEKENEKAAKEKAQNEVDRLTKELEKANNEIKLQKEINEKAESDVISLTQKFEQFLIKMQKNEKKNRFEAERIAKRFIKFIRINHERSQSSK